MAEYPDFKHGTRSEINADGSSLTGRGRTKMAFVYIGTAPVHLVEGGAANVNVPVLVNNMGDAKRVFGYSDNWADYTLCEAMYEHFERRGVGPLVLINVLNPTTKRKSTGGSATLTPENGRVRVVNAEDAILDTVVVVSDGTTLVKGTHYTLSYDYARKCIDIVEKTSGSLGTDALSITWAKVDPSAVATSDVIGASDGYGLNTGVYAVKNVYNVTGYIPFMILAPGFSSIPAVHNAMYLNSQQISKHWNAWMYVDMPILDTQGNAITLQTAPTWKNANGYNKDNEDVFFPIVKGTDGRTYHLSVLAAASKQELMIQNDGIPYMPSSNTECDIIQDLYFGESYVGRVYDDEIINRCLNANGINSAAYVGRERVRHEPDDAVLRDQRLPAPPEHRDRQAHADQHAAEHRRRGAGAPGRPGRHRRAHLRQGPRGRQQDRQERRGAGRLPDPLRHDRDAACQEPDRRGELDGRGLRSLFCRDGRDGLTAGAQKSEDFACPNGGRTRE